MEMLDVYDKYRNLTRKILKNQYNTLKENEYILHSYVAIFNQENEMLIQKRNSHLEKYPNLWDISASGRVLADEISEDSIERMLIEELGYKKSFSENRAYFTINYEKSFCDVYIINDDIDINKLRLNYEKVQNVTWATKDEILQLIDEGKFVPYEHSFIGLLFFNKDTRGVIIGEK